ncbi:dnaJ homolog subfamily C member 16 [Drosophila ficusphila]|uniref:dnaJ homolog subfamily C member 16 n=1 Tax=Drosophila ficusphila TaxID=30025 RepID=UPI001C88F243|nr:dnaJ homolog subfamily C member 16 [Drosophila ficusphila]XP_043065435.1 dnaJ homolog subfamily C member 16 [Drosophila ficusphila]
MMFKPCFVVIYIITVMCTTVSFSLGASNNPYDILGLKKIATTQEIRKAYRQLAKEWHPDKVQNDPAAAKFVKIKLAYELLSNPDRRRIFDQHGVTDEDSYYLKKKHDYSGYNRFSIEENVKIFDKRPSVDQGIDFFHKLSITTNYFDKTIVPNSANQLYIVIFYNDWCFKCTRIVGALRRIIDLLEPLGINFVTVNAAHEERIFRKTGAGNVPQLVLVLDSKFFLYRDHTFTPQKVVEFIRKKLPFKIVQLVNDNNLNDFLGGWMDNKVRALIFEPYRLIRLRYLLTAFEFYDRVAFGFVDMNSRGSNNTIARFNVNTSVDTLLIFNEDSSRFIASISMPDIPIQTLKNIVTSNQFLVLPRLSSQGMLERVCPSEWNRPRKRLCVILITEKNTKHDLAREALREIALTSVYSSKRVRFAYLFKENQPDFIQAVSNGTFGKNLLPIVIIWRRDDKHIKYEWVPGIQLFTNVTVETLINSTKIEISCTLKRLLKSSEALSHEAFVQKLFNEHSQGILPRWISRFMYLVDYLSDNMEDEHLLAVFSLLGTIVFMFAVGYILMYYVRTEEKNLKAQGHLNNSQDHQHNKLIPELKLYEMRAEKYNGMVRLLKPGCRTLLLITDFQSRYKLIPNFHKAVWPYRKSKTLLFGHMSIEKGLPWFTEILRLSLCSKRKLQVNPRNCVGTVLALNGHRKYFCMYHAKHPESDQGTKRILKITKSILNTREDPEVGSFLKKSYSEDSEAESNILLEDNLLNSLDNWLERLFDGKTQKYYINYWPDFPNK